LLDFPLFDSFISKSDNHLFQKVIQTFPSFRLHSVSVKLSASSFGISIVKPSWSLSISMGKVKSSDYISVSRTMKSHIEQSVIENIKNLNKEHFINALRNVPLYSVFVFEECGMCGIQFSIAS
jgi:hypothetical protein